MSSVPEHVVPRKIRSFVRRQGRMTQGQHAALDTLSSQFCLQGNQPLVAAEVFGRNAPLCVEIGFGNGDCLAQIAAANPDKDYVGIEVHRPGVGQLLMRLGQLDLHNVRVYCHDALEVLAHNIPDGCLYAVHLFFPDPWPKRKHHKRRIVQAEFLDLVAAKLIPGGYFHAATDWENYAKAMLATFEADLRFKNSNPCGGASAKPDYRPLTKFEGRGLRLGHGIWDLIFVKR